MKNNLIVPISTDPVMGTPRQALLDRFQILPDLNMLFAVRVQHLTTGGQLKLDIIESDPSLTDYQKRVARQQFADQVPARQTTGSFVDPATGDLVPEGTAGAILQRDYFQAVTLGNLKAQGMTINDSTTLAELIYAMLEMEIIKSDQRKEI